SENTEYKKFSFYCIDCGMRLSGTNVHKAEVLTKENKSTHFKIHTHGQLHTDDKCLNHNPGYQSPTKKHSPKRVIIGDSIVYTKFKLSQINYEVVKGLGKKDPSHFNVAKIALKSSSTIECDLYTTSILKDLVNCFEELNQISELENFPLDIEGNNRDDNNYSKVFKNILIYNSGKYEKLNEKNDYFFKFRILYGKSSNSCIKKENIGWSFLISFEKHFPKEKYKFRESIEGKEKERNILVRIFIPTKTLDKYIILRDQYLKEEKDKIIDQFYITNCKPELKQWKKKDGTSTYEEFIFVVQNLNHIHLTFKDSK
ncbi:MAG: hypothetical protein WA945_00385, partial [Arcobacteraceae bacterium]